MRKNVFVFLVIVFSVLSLFFFLNMKVTTYRGVNYKVSSEPLPLYLKLLNFYDRHYSYKWLAKRITGDLGALEDKVLRLFQWVHENIQPQPKILPVMDDHPWNVYIRGYGVTDNYHDLFSTLANYLGTKAFFKSVSIDDAKEGINISFVEMTRGWVLFDPYNGVYFNNKNGALATIEEVKAGNWKMKSLTKVNVTESYYRPYLDSLPNMSSIKSGRSAFQAPMNRLMLQLEQWYSGEKPLFQ